MRDIKKMIPNEQDEIEYKRFLDNYGFNRRLALETEKPHLARWAYGACEEWIKDFEKFVSEADISDRIQIDYTLIIESKKRNLRALKSDLRTKFSDNEILMEMLK